MKKFATITFYSMLIILISTVPIFAGGTVKLGADFSGDHELSAFGESVDADDVDTGICLSAEIFGTAGNHFDIGGGIIFQFPRSASFQGVEGDFNFLPFYGMIRARLNNENIDPYLIGQIGYNLFFADDDYGGPNADYEGGMYWGLGGGVIIKKHFLIEVLYSVNNGQVTLFGIEGDIENSQTTINIGYNF